MTERLKSLGRPLYSMVGRDSTDWLPTAFRTHTLGDIGKSGSELVGQEVTVAGHAEISRGRRCLFSNA